MRPLAAAALGLALGACCGPAKCLQARSGKTALEGTVADIEAFKERNGRYPVRLEDIRKGYEDSLARVFNDACPTCTPAEYRTDSFGYELEFNYKEYGKVRCLKNNEADAWDCKGIY
jgi:hypothetical protein